MYEKLLVNLFWFANVGNILPIIKVYCWLQLLLILVSFVVIVVVVVGIGANKLLFQTHLKLVGWVGVLTIINI